MINIPKFDTDFVGRKFKTTNGLGPEYTIVGYGDNGSNGNPYFVAMSEQNGQVLISTHRFKDVILVP